MYYSYYICGSNNRRNHALPPEIWQKSGITHQILKTNIKPLTFQHKIMFIVFTFNTQVETCILMEKIGDEILGDESGGIYPIQLCLLLTFEKLNTKVILQFVSGCVILKTQELSLLFWALLRLFHFFG